MKRNELKRMIASDSQHLLRFEGESKIAYNFKRFNYSGWAINALFCLILLACVAACGLAAKSSYHKCKVYSKGDAAAMRDCLGV